MKVEYYEVSINSYYIVSHCVLLFQLVSQTSFFCKDIMTSLFNNKEHLHVPTKTCVNDNQNCFKFIVFYLVWEKIQRHSHTIISSAIIQVVAMIRENFIGTIIDATPGSGKSYLVENYNGFVDADEIILSPNFRMDNDAHPFDKINKYFRYAPSIANQRLYPIVADKLRMMGIL